MSYRRYWDLGAEERATLTDEQIKQFEEVELMEKGVRRPVKPELTTIAERKLPTKAFFKIGDYSAPILFHTQEDVQKFLELGPMKRDTLTSSSYDIIVEYAVPMTEADFNVKELAEKDAVMAMEEELKRDHKLKDANSKAMDEYRKALTNVDEALADLYEDLTDSRAKVSRYTTIRTTYQEYLGMCGGNEQTALSFLLKAHPEEMVKMAMPELFTAKLEGSES